MKEILIVICIIILVTKILNQIAVLAEPLLPSHKFENMKEYTYSYTLLGEESPTIIIYTDSPVTLKMGQCHRNWQHLIAQADFQRFHLNSP